MRGAAKHGQHTQFRGSFGRAADPFPTLLASGVTPFAFWYADDPAGSCIRFPTEIESERLMGLPDNWTKYGENGELIPSMHRYRALGNSVYLIMVVMRRTDVKTAPGEDSWRSCFT